MEVQWRSGVRMSDDGVYDLVMVWEPVYSSVFLVTLHRCLSSIEGKCNIDGSLKTNQSKQSLRANPMRFTGDFLVSLTCVYFFSDDVGVFFPLHSIYNKLLLEKPGFKAPYITSELEL